MTGAPRAAWRWVSIAATLLGPFAALPLPAAAEVIKNLSAADLFELADRARTKGNHAEAAKLYDALSNDPDADVRAEARFRKGLMFADQRRYLEAATAFRALLDEKPDAVRARLELARMLAAMGDESSARRALRQAQASGLPPDVAVTVDQFARAIRATRRLGGSLQVALAPDSNINRATQLRTLDTVIAPLTLSRDARAQSGVGLSVAAQGFAKLSLGERLSLVPKLSGSGNFYRDGTFNDISGSALIGLEWQQERQRWSLSLGKTYRWYGGQRYATTDTVALDWLRTFGGRTQLVANGSISRARYLRNAAQDGKIFDLGLTAEHVFKPTWGGSLTLSATRQSARDPGYATTSGGVVALAWHELGAATVFASVGGRRTVGDARLFLFPDARREWLLNARIGATLRQLAFKGFAPLVRLGYERNSSTVPIYAYRRVVGEVGLARSF